MSRYNTIIKNDVANGEGIRVSFFVQGCPHHCPNCFNKETWDFDKGHEYTNDIKWEIIKAINANGIVRNFSILGGEPLAPNNLKMVNEVITAVRAAYPDIDIILWTGYTFEELDKNNEYIESILNKINRLVDGKFVEELKDLTLALRGSSNQRIWKRDNNIWEII